MKLNKHMKYSNNYIFIILKICNNEIDRKRLERKLIKILNPDLNKFKKERNSNIKIKGDILDLYTYTKEDESCYCLNYFTQQSGNHTIQFKTGNHDISNWRTIYKNLKNKDIYLNQEKISISKLEKRIKKLKNGTIEIIDKPFFIKEYRKKLKDVKNNFKLSNEKQLEYLWKNKNLIKDYYIRRNVKKILCTIIEWKYNIRILNKFYLKIPYLNISKEELKQELKQLLILYPKFIRKIIFQKIRIVFTKRKNIGDILLNHIKYCSRINSRLPLCNCKINSKDPKKHEIFRLEDIDFLTDEEKQLIRIKDIPLPHSPNNYFNIKTAITNLIIKIGKCINDEVKHNIERISLVVTKTKKKEKNQYIKEIDILRIKTKLKNWIIAPLDKNSGSIAIICPYLYRDMCFANFRWEGPTKKFKKVINKASIEDNIFQFNKMMKLFPFKKGTLPIAYIIPKNKNLNKYRPIISYSNHSLKKLLKIASRGLFHILKNIKSIKHFNITKSTEFMEFIKDIKLKSSKQYMLIKGDIKEMFSNIPHEELKKTINWFINIYKQEHNSEIISIKVNGKIETYTGYYDGKKKRLFKEITLDQIKNIAFFDIDNAFMKFGNYILKQIIGIPMGSPISPILATLYCSRAEYYFLTSINMNLKIQGVRYIDDILLIIESKTKKDFNIKVENIIKDLDGLYKNNSGVKLEIEEKGEKVNFLENEVSIYNNKIEIDYINKNEKSIEEKNKQSITRLKSYHSFDPIEQKIGTIIGFFIRVYRLTIREEDLLHCIGYIIKELEILKYPKNIIRNALYKMKIKTDNIIWNTAAYFL